MSAERKMVGRTSVASHDWQMVIEHLMSAMALANLLPDGGEAWRAISDTLGRVQDMAYAATVNEDDQLRSDGRALERKAGLPLLKAWLMARAERKSFRMSNGDRAVTTAEVIQVAEYDLRDYVGIAEARPDYMGSVDELVEEMRLAVTADNLEGYDDEGTQIVNDYDGAILNDLERSALLAKLNQMADDAEARIRAVTMSMFDRIGAPKGDRRRLARAQVAAPGAHKAYSGR